MNVEPVSLDTTVVLRLLVQEPPAQYREASILIESLLQEGAAVHVSDLVLSEAYFALQHHYGIEKASAVTMIRAFVRETGLNFTAVARQVVESPDLATANPGFVDRLIHGASHAAGQVLLTFEKAARKLPRTRVLRG